MALLAGVTGVGALVAGAGRGSWARGAVAGRGGGERRGEIEAGGPGAEDFLRRVLSNDVAKLAVGGAQSPVLGGKDGGGLDDLLTYRRDDERYLTVTNASNHERDLAWFRDHAG